MWIDLQETEDLFTFTKEILNRKLHFYVQVNKVKGNIISQSLHKHNVSSSSPSSSHSAPIKVNHSSIIENHDEFKPKSLHLWCTIVCGSNLRHLYEIYLVMRYSIRNEYRDSRDRSTYSVLTWENTDLKKLQIWTLIKQW